MGKKIRELECLVTPDRAALKSDQSVLLRFVLALLEQAVRLIRDLLEGR